VIEALERMLAADDDNAAQWAATAIGQIAARCAQQPHARTLLETGLSHVTAMHTRAAIHAVLRAL
jgi:hypothetical protein